MWRRNIAPQLQDMKLEWVNFQVLRRTHSSLMQLLKVDPKLVADQMGHTLDVNQNVYTQTSLPSREQAVATLENALGTLNRAISEQRIETPAVNC